MKQCAELMPELLSSGVCPGTPAELPKEEQPRAEMLREALGFQEMLMHSGWL